MRFIDLMGVALLAIFFALALCLLVRCTPVPVPVPPDPTPRGGAGPVIDGCLSTQQTCGDCQAAAARIEELACRDESGTPLWQTPGGKPFWEACDYSASQGRDWKPECLKTIRDCGEIDAAMRGLVCR